ncbi:MAG: BspA family leucine-rich repeat surface protein [Lachnospiraceae bacterium]|nr:BspA family leucine-rich repeat surface protein [Lachnospiraceae bacterium]
MGLTGEVTAVEVSDESLFSASDETGEWVVKALSAFQSEEWMKVTIDGVEYEIKVTDDIASGDGWYIDNDGCLHITGAVTNPDTHWGELTPWGSYRSSIKSAIAEEGSSIDNGRWLFAECKNLVSADLHNLDTSSVTDMNSMFHACWGLTTLNITGFDTSNVTDMATMFGGCKVLTDLDVSGFDTSNVTTMDAMFFGCEKVQALDISGFDTSKVEDMYGMFSNCRTLTELDVSGFDTSQVIELREMFYGCSGLTSLDVSGFDTSSAQVVTWMFAGCSSLESLDMSNWNVSSLLTDDFSEGAYEFATLGMFDDCEKLEEIGISKGLLDRTIDQLTELNEEWFHRDDAGTNADLGEKSAVFLEKYSVRIEDDGNGKATADAFGNLQGRTIILIPDPKPGYHFKEWQTWDVEIRNNAFTMPRKNVKIKAIFEKDAPTTPKTGDNSHLLLWVLRIVVSGAALTGTVIYRRKKLLGS